MLLVVKKKLACELKKKESNNLLLTGRLGTQSHESTGVGNLSVSIISVLKTERDNSTLQLTTTTALHIQHLLSSMVQWQIF